MSKEQGFLDDLRQDPSSSARWVYGDWLEEQGRHKERYLQAAQANCWGWAMLWENAVLCYVDSTAAYFTTQSLDKQWGDDWNDVPYEHNAGVPYYDWEGKENPRWEIAAVWFYNVLDLPGQYSANSAYSVEMINRKEVPWLEAEDYVKGGPVKIYAGETLPRFCKTIERMGVPWWPYSI